MNLVILIIGVVLFGEFLKRFNAAGNTSTEQSRVGAQLTNFAKAPDGSLVVTNTPITEAAYNQDGSVAYAPAFGASAVEYDGTEYLL